MGLKSGSKSGKGSKQGPAKLNTSKNQQQVASKQEDSDDEPEMDTSVLRPSIEISVSGVPQLVQAYQAATDELRSVLAKECDIIYECRVCRNLFRSVANMMAHKRVYCTTTYSYSRHTLNRNHMVEDYTVVVQPEPVPSNSQEIPDWSTSDKLPDATTQNTSTNLEVISHIPRIVPKTKKGLKEIVAKLTNNTCDSISNIGNSTSATKLYDTVNTSLLARKNDIKQHSYQLEDMETSKVGKFQTKLASTSTLNNEKEDLMKAQVSELHNMTSQNEALLGPDGRAIMLNGISPLSAQSSGTDKISNINLQKSTKDEHVCPDCNVKFSTRKTLNHHMKSLHVMFRLCYPCPCCKSTFVNPWSVYRHLYKVHRKTNAQVRRLRPQIQKKAFRKEINAETSTQEANAKTDALKETQRLDQENQAWMDNFEDDLELQRCGGCGRRFERKAALNSHSQICQKRIAARNNVKVIRTVTNTSNSDKPTKTDNEPLELENSKRNSNSGKGSDSSSNSPGTSRIRNSGNNSWTESPKKEVPEKKIEIQIRKDYCKMSSAGSVIALSTDTQSEPDSRPVSPVAEDESLDNMRDWDSMIEMEEVGKDDDIYPVYDSVQDQPNDQPNEGDNHHSDGTEKSRKRRICSEDEEQSMAGSVGDDEEDSLKRRKQQSEKINEEQSIQNLPSTSKTRKLEEFHPVMAARMMKLINLRRLQCLPCQKKFIKLTNLRRHVAVHIGWCRYRCTACSFKCFSKYDCVDHVCKVHLKGSQRTKAASMVQYIDEQELEKSVYQEQSKFSNSPNQYNDDEETLEPMDSAIKLLNIEDIKNIVGVTSYPDIEKSTEVQEKPGELSTEDNGPTQLVEDEAVADTSKSSDDSDIAIIHVESVPLREFEKNFESSSEKNVSEETKETKEVEHVESEHSTKEDSPRDYVSVIEDKQDAERNDEPKVPFKEDVDEVIEILNNEQGCEYATEAEQGCEYATEAEPGQKPVDKSKDPGITEEDIQELGDIRTEEREVEVLSNVNEQITKEVHLGSSSIPVHEEEIVPPVDIVDVSSSSSNEGQKNDSICLPERESVIDNKVLHETSDQNLKDESEIGSNRDSIQSTSCIKKTNDDVPEAELHKESSSVDDVITLDTSGEEVKNSDNSSVVNEKESALRKMVMEVIFGSGTTSSADADTNQNLFSVSLNGNMFEGESSDGRSSRASNASDVDIVVISSANNHVPSVNTKQPKPRTDVEHVSAAEFERRERPVRNRVKATKEDFIYDFSDSFLKKDEASKTVSKKKQVDSIKDVVKVENTTRNTNIVKCIPKLMLVRTDVNNISGTAKGTWSSVYAQSTDCASNKSSIATNPQTCSTSKKTPRAYDVKQ